MGLCNGERNRVVVSMPLHLNGHTALLKAMHPEPRLLEFGR